MRPWLDVYLRRAWSPASTLPTGFILAKRQSREYIAKVPPAVHSGDGAQQLQGLDQLRSPHPANHKVRYGMQGRDSRKDQTFAVIIGVEHNDLHQGHFAWLSAPIEGGLCITDWMLHSSVRFLCIQCTSL